jgi:Ca2+-binding RTX toxin-like protein
MSVTNTLVLTDHSHKVSYTSSTGDPLTVDRAITVKVFAPDTPGKYPVIFYSHGFSGGPAGGAGTTAEALAAQGYIVIEPIHLDSALTAADMRSSFTLTNPATVLHRVADMQYVMAHAAATVSGLPAGYVADLTKTVAAGHSMGAMTSAVLSGATSTIADYAAATAPGNPYGLTTLADSHVKATLLISPQGDVGTGSWHGIGPNSWDSVRVPMLTLTGTADNGTDGAKWNDRLDAFTSTPNGNEHALVISNATHDQMGGNGAPGVTSEVASAAKTFLDAYLNNSAAAVAALCDLRAYAAAHPLVAELFERHSQYTGATTAGTGLIFGTSNADKLEGATTADTFVASGGNDSISGNGGADTVDYSLQAAAVSATITAGGGTVQKGADGTDTLASIELVIGSKLTDVFNVDSSVSIIGNGGADVLNELSANVSLIYGGNFSGISTVNLLSGTNTVNVASDTAFIKIVGGAGTDMLTAGSGGAYLDGGAGADILTGGSGADTLWSSYGADGVADTLAGGGGNDTYIAYETADTVTETDANPATGGYDLVYTGASYTLGANVEYLYAFGGGTITALTGNTLDNSISAINYYGGSGMTITAGDGNDTVYGSYYADTILGGNGTDTLWGSWGADNAADTMTGGAGADTYVVQEALDTVIETDATAAGGLDLVYSAISYTLGANVEYLQIYGNATTGTGNALGNLIAASYSGVNTQLFGLDGADQLVGGAGNDRLDGGSGADTLIGSTGNDTFVFVAGEANGDVITDFNGNGVAAGDSLELSGYGAGATFTNIDATHWQVNYGAGLTNHEIITLTNSAAINAQDVLFV